MSSTKDDSKKGIHADDILERAPKKQRVLELDPLVIIHIGDLVMALKRCLPAIIRKS